MEKHFPDILRHLMQASDVKQVLLLNYLGDGSCDNCGGSGTISFFLATMGPLDEPAAGKMVSKWHNGKWWAAPSSDLRHGTLSAPCPDCARSRRLGPFVPMPREIPSAMNTVLNKKRIS